MCMMIACKNKKGLERVIDFQNKEYAIIIRAYVYESDNLDYLGMLFTFGKEVKVAIDMISMVSEFLRKLEISLTCCRSPIYGETCKA